MTTQSQAELKQVFNTFCLYWENDTFFGTDRDYTNGLKLTWSTPYKTDETTNHLPQWSYPVINRLPFVNDLDKERAVSLSIGQDIYTPEEINRSDLIEEDRPYVGYSYLALGFHSRTEGRKNSWEFQIGLVGPHSYAEDIQNWVHDLTASKHAQGWDNQLDDEFTFLAVCESQWRLYGADLNENISYDLIPHLGGGIGNVSIYANTGVEARIGWNLRKNFGTCPIRAGCETTSAVDENGIDLSRFRLFGIHLFVSAEGRAVMWDITLDGNTYKDSHSVDKEVFVAYFIAGIGLEYGTINMSCSYIYGTKQFETQDVDPIFGSFSISFTY